MDIDGETVCNFCDLCFFYYYHYIYYYYCYYYQLGLHRFPHYLELKGAVWRV